MSQSRVLTLRAGVRVPSTSKRAMILGLAGMNAVDSATRLQTATVEIKYNEPVSLSAFFTAPREFKTVRIIRVGTTGLG